MGNPKELSAPYFWERHQDRPTVSHSDTPGLCICWECKAWRELQRVTGERDRLREALGKVQAEVEHVNTRRGSRNGRIRAALSEVSKP